ncbi:hypothetical protein [Sphingorhabdus sp.]|jgi:hypothetical protein|uniref:hypothetical protein n=1 Tax=Sphingorhabdus sp. TaxID=1902408 RepID=UPI0035B33E99|nr:hypothetical protein [Sphingomonadaceae bacterium]
MKTIREGTAGKAKLRLVDTGKGFVAIAIEGGKTILQKDGKTADEAWNALQAALTREGPNWFGYLGARSRFLHWFAGGFHSTAYLAQERDYKIKAKEDFETTTPLEEAATGSGHGEAVLRAYRATNLLYPIEKTRMQGLLRGSDGDNFIRAAARFALGEGKSALRAMETLLRPHDNAKWTVVSYLPYLWRPDSHIFLKPEVTKDFAARVSHPLASSYVSDLDYGVYEDLLDMAGVIRQSVIDLEPRDMIDIQSVIWVVGDYREGREIPQP